MNRRQFLQNSAILSAASLLPAESYLSELKVIKKMGIQLFSLPRMLDKDFRTSIKMLSEMGYKEIEMFGPYPFSAQVAIDNWKALGSALGFNGSGYFGKTAAEVKSIFNEYKVTTPSVHTDFDTLVNNMAQLGEASQALGFKYVVLPAIPDNKRQTLDDYRKIADTFNKIGTDAKKYGLKFGYHNHGYGLKEKDGKIPLQIILDNTDPNLVFLEMDIFWTTAGGADPIEYLKKYKNRYHLMHLKDMKEKKTFSGDGSNAAQWIELFPFMTTAGNGVLDLKSIVKTAKECGAKHFFVEQDMVAEPEIALKKSLDYLKIV